MKISNCARNYALKHGVHIYGLTSDDRRALVFYDIESGTKLCTYKAYGDNRLSKSLNYKMKPETWAEMPEEIWAAMGVQKAIDAMVKHGDARKLSEDEVNDARNKQIARATGVTIV